MGGGGQQQQRQEEKKKKSKRVYREIRTVRVPPGIELQRTALIF